MGKRVYALFALMLNTCAPVQEILDLRLCDIRTDPPHQVRLHGKGGKTRLYPIGPQTARLLLELYGASRAGGSESPLRSLPAQEAHHSRPPPADAPGPDAGPHSGTTLATTKPTLIECSNRMTFELL